MSLKAWIATIIAGGLGGVLTLWFPAKSPIPFLWSLVSDGFRAFWAWLTSTVTLSVYTILFWVLAWLITLAASAYVAKRAATPAPDSWPVLSDSETSTLYLIFSANNAGADPDVGQLGQRLNMSRVELDHALEVLAGHYLVQFKFDYFKGNTFSLSPKGRKYAVAFFLDMVEE